MFLFISLVFIVRCAFEYKYIYIYIYIYSVCVWCVCVCLKNRESRFGTQKESRCSECGLLLQKGGWKMVVVVVMISRSKSNEKRAWMGVCVCVCYKWETKIKLFCSNNEKREVLGGVQKEKEWTNVLGASRIPTQIGYETDRLKSFTL